MTKAGSTNISRQKKNQQTHEVPGEQSGAGFLLYNQEILLDGQDLLHDAPTSAYQTTSSLSSRRSVLIPS